MVIVSPPEFLQQLQNLFISARSKGNIQITQKSYNGIEKPKPRDTKNNKNKISEYENTPCNKVLIRAKTPKQKLSTVVDSSNLLEFQLSYTKLLRASMDGLKKRDKAGKKRQAAKKAKEGGKM